MYQVLKRIGTENKIPEDWCKGIIVPIYRKRNRKQCENNSEITLLYQTFKIYNRMVANKTIKEIEGKLAEELYTFKAGKATRDLISGMRQVTEKNCKYGEEFLMVFIDYKKAFNSVKKEEIRKNLEKIGIAADLLIKV
jgi:hypothetical protein